MHGCCIWNLNLIVKYILFIYLIFLGPHPHMEVPRLGVELEQQLLAAYTEATAKQDLNRVCDLHHSLQQCWILNLLSKARDRTCNLMVPSQIHFCCAVTGTHYLFIFWFCPWHVNVLCQELNCATTVTWTAAVTIPDP